MNAIILCGGLSTRLGDITKDIPKVLLEVGPKHILDWQLAKLKSFGINEVVLAAGHLARILRNNIGNERRGVRLIYAIENKRLGTGGAIKHALGYVSRPGEPVMILNGDILYTVDFTDMANCLNKKSDGIILGTRVDDASSYGTLIYDERKRLKEFREKEGQKRPGYINGGLYLFNPSITGYFPKRDEFSMEYDVFPKIKNLYVYESDTPWVDIGVPERLDWARKNWEVFAGNMA